jgi:hypothetical protein
MIVDDFVAACGRFAVSPLGRVIRRAFWLTAACLWALTCLWWIVT